MTKAEFDEVAHHLGATLVFNTSPCAVFKRGAATFSVDIPATELATMVPLDVVKLLVDAAGPQAKPWG